ncbi:TetR/AcrR family transcriptional regulator [Pelosinus fermentans]|uniref:TetR/AcrR family transcriptional regulator n=1 Tax=Pelosinus fermentans TaxID=365349 RepID=UPI0002F57902|nr:TetR/AcrR family transcriptional regulator [Pelosinus fermentans]
MTIIVRTIKDPEVRRSELIDAAQELFIAFGYNKTMIIDIVKKAGVAKGTFYYYFPSKEAILEAIIARYSTKLAAEIKNLGPSVTALHKLRLLIGYLFRFDQTDIVFYLLWEEQEFSLLFKTWKQSDTILNPVLTDVIQQGTEEGTMHVQSIDETICFFWSTLSCLWESQYNKEAPNLFTSKSKIAEVILERILGISEGSLALKILI